MTRGLIVLWLTVGVLALGCPLSAWSTLASAQRDADERCARLASLQRTVEEVERLRAMEPAWTSDSKGESPLAERLSRVLLEAGVQASALESFAPHSRAVQTPSGVSLSRRSVSFTLAPVTLPRLGTFLARWRQEEPAWLVSSIEVSPDAASTPKDTSPGSDQPLRAGLVVESLVADSPGARP